MRKVLATLANPRWSVFTVLLISPSLICSSAGPPGGRSVTVSASCVTGDVPDVSVEFAHAGGDADVDGVGTAAVGVTEVVATDATPPHPAVATATAHAPNTRVVLML